jgi:hypothetical protein
MRHPLPTTSSCSPFLAALLGLASLAGCDPVDDGEGLELLDAAEDHDALDDAEAGELEAADELAAEPDAAAQQLMWSYSWQQGQPAVAMGAFDDRFCFLTEVAGHFGSGYERARVYEWNGSWWLGGMGFQEGIRASALCIPRDYWGLELEVSGEYIWREGTPFVDMGPATGRVCMLTHVQGDLDGEGDGVEAYPTLGPGGRWWLGGVSSDGAGGVMGAARCIDIDPAWLHGPYNWAKNPMGSTPPLQLIDADDYACGLTKVLGAFDNWNERVGAYVGGNDMWYLHGGTWSGNNAFSIGTWTTAYCF